MKKLDYHIHSEFSSDSANTMENIIQKAIAQNYEAIAFTDHFDFVSSETAHFGIPSLRNYFNALTAIRKKYKQLEIVYGVEVGEYQHVHEYADQVFAYYPPELKIGSIHVLPDDKNISVPLNFQMTTSDILSYYKENLGLVEYGNIHILGHLGIYKRYFSESPDESCCEEVIRAIFENIIRKDIALEVNYSGFRKKFNRTIPEQKHLMLFKEMGGKLLSIGSDSHTLESFNDYYDKTIDLIKSIGFKDIGIWKKNKWEMFGV